MPAEAGDPAACCNGGEDADALARAHDDASARVADLRAELSAIAESTAASPDDEHDAEGATVGFERARVGALLAAAEESLRDVDAALARRRAGTYGRCEACGGPIAPARLDALPTTRRCLACASRR